MSAIDEARAAGYSDDEISAHLAERMQAARAAGYSEQEIRQHLGIPEPRPDPAVPGAFLDRLAQGGMLERIARGAGAASNGFDYSGEANAFDRAFAAGFGPERLGLTDAGEKWFRDSGLFRDPERGTGGPIRLMNEAMLRPAAAGVDFVLRGLNATAYGVAAMAGEGAKLAGAAPAEAGRLTRDLVHLSQSIGFQLSGGGGFSRATRSPGGGIVEQPLGHLPAAGEFETTARALAGPAGDTAIAGKLERLWTEHGIHPAEVPADAAADVGILQDLAAENRDLPRAYAREAAAAPESGPPSADRAPGAPEVPGKAQRPAMEPGEAVLREEGPLPEDSGDHFAGIERNPEVRETRTRMVQDRRPTLPNGQPNPTFGQRVPQQYEVLVRKGDSPFMPLPTGADRLGLSEWIRAQGGFHPTDPMIGDVRAIIAKGDLRMISRGGLSIDYLRERAAELGYLPADSTPRDLLDLLARDYKARAGGYDIGRVYPTHGSDVALADEVAQVTEHNRAVEEAAHHFDIDPAGLTIDKFLRLVEERASFEERAALSEQMTRDAEGYWQDHVTAYSEPRRLQDLEREHAAINADGQRAAGGADGAGAGRAAGQSADAAGAAGLPQPLHRPGSVPAAPAGDLAGTGGRPAAEVAPAPSGAGGGGAGEPPPRVPHYGEFAEVPEPPAGSDAAARDRILAKIQVGGSDYREKLTWQRLYTLTVDSLNPVRELVKRESRGGPLPAAADDPYILFRLTRGTMGKAEQFLERGTYDFNSYADNGPGLRQVLAPVADDLNGLRAYAAARRALELDGRGIESGFDLDAARQVVAADRARFEPVLRDLVAYSNRVTAYLRDAGVISRAGYDAMLRGNEQFVPFYRVMDPELRGRGQPGGLGASNPIKALKGSQRDIVDPLESVIKNTYAYMALAEKNAAGVKLIELLERPTAIRLAPAEAPLPPELAADRRLPGPRVSELPPPEETAPAVRVEIPQEVVPAEIADFLAGSGAEAAAADLHAVFRYASPDDGFVIRVLRDGRPEEWRVGPDVARAWRALDQESVNFLVRMLAVPARMLRAGATLTPDFMVRNAGRDFLTAFVNSKGLFSPLDTVRGLLSAARQDEMFQMWLKGGGANSAMVSLDRTYLRENLFRLSDQSGLQRGWNVVSSPLAMLRVTSELIENATRLGEFRKVLGDDFSKASIQEAAFASREVTLDFARIGAKTRALNMISAFANASIQGTDRLVREAASRPFNFATKVAAGVTAPSLLLWWANHDDPRWQEIPRWQKDLFWIVMTDNWVDQGPATGAPLDLNQRVQAGRVQRNDGHVFRIPKDFVVGTVFGSLPERMLDAFYADNPAAFKDLSKAIVDGLVPNLVPTAATPIIEQFSNRSMFFDGDLVPRRLEKILPEYQYQPYTTEASKALGRLFGAFPGMKDASLEAHAVAGPVARALTTPILIENYVRAWTGGLGNYALQAADLGLRKAGVLDDPAKPAPTLADIPFVKAFVVRYPSAGAQSIQDFHDAYHKQEILYATVQMKAKEGDLAAVRATLDYAPSAMVKLGQRSETLNEHSALIRMVTINPQIPPAEKRQIIDTAYFRMIDLARAGNATVREMKAVFDRPGGAAGDSTIPLPPKPAKPEVPAPPSLPAAPLAAAPLPRGPIQMPQLGGFQP